MTGASIRFPHLGIVIEHLGKSISIFGFDIAYYGIIIGVGMLCGIAMAVHEAKRTGQNPEMYYDFALCAIISAIVGCRIYYVAYFLEDQEGQSASDGRYGCAGITDRADHRQMGQFL